MLKQTIVIAFLLGVCLAASSEEHELDSTESREDLKLAESTNSQFFGNYGGLGINGYGGYGGIGGLGGYGAGYGGIGYGGLGGYGGIGGIRGYGNIGKYGGYGGLLIGRPLYGGYPYYG